jgi:DnaJ-class molecular chaperone
MTHEYRNAAAMKRAQWAYDNMSPPEGGPCDCPDCNGSGEVESASDIDGDLIECPFCGGSGKVDENGEPWIEGDDE